MEWSEEQAAAAARKVQENSSQLVCPEKQGALGGFPSWEGGTRPLEGAKEVQPPGSFVYALVKNLGIERGGEGTS